MLCVVGSGYASRLDGKGVRGEICSGGEGVRGEIHFLHCSLSSLLLCNGARDRADGMLRSALISALSACLAVCTTLLFQHYWFGPADTAVHQHVPAIPAADTDARRQQDSADIAAPAANAIDLAQALGLGRVLLSRGEPEEAALVYRVATATALSAHDGDPGTNRDGGEAQHGLGLALLAVGRPQEALEACVEAERLDSSSAESSLCVGVLLVETGDTAGAVDAFRRALSRAAVAREGSETFDAIRGRLGGALLDAGEVDEAISVMADDNNGNNGNIAYHLGVAWQTKVCSMESSVRVTAVLTHHAVAYISSRSEGTRVMSCIG